MAYKHGVYGEQVAYAGGTPQTSTGTVPAYIGTAPIHQLNTAGASDFDYSPYINKAVVLSSYAAASGYTGYSSDWEAFTACEAISAHFLAPDTPIGPIICVNMADPTVLESTDTTTTVTLSGAYGSRVGYINDPLAAIENIALGALVSGYSMEYSDDSIKVTITDETYTDATIDAAYKRIDVSTTAITAAKMETALDALDVVEQSTGYIPNIIAAPGWSQLPDYHEKMLTKVKTKLAEKWYSIMCSDIPSTETVNTPALAIAWKSENGYTSKWDKVFWPMVRYGTEKYHLSTIACVKMQTIDTDAGDVPYISPSNKVIPADSTVLADGTEILLSETVANGMNEVGITTTNIIRGALRLWGLHMANYSYATQDSIDPENRQDAGVRMGMYMLNYLQYNYLDRVDNPIARRDIDAILASVQQWLNAMVNAGQLLYGTVSFVASENSTSDMQSGDFVFTVKDTTTPNAKSLTFKSQYVDDGLSALTATGGEA